MDVDVDESISHRLIDWHQHYSVPIREQLLHGLKTALVHMQTRNRTSHHLIKVPDYRLNAKQSYLKLHLVDLRRGSLII